jgi:predicted dehydrogenase
MFQVTALGDISPTVLDKVGESWNVAGRFTDYRELVRQENVDAVLVTNPHVYHAEVILAAIDAGKHVLAEKPMCLTLGEADEISQARQRAGVVVQVGYMRRYASAFTEACALVKQMGQLRLARIHDVIGHNALIISQSSRVIRGSDVPSQALAAANLFQQERVTEAIGDAPKELRQAYMLLLGLSSHDTSAMREMLGMPRGVLYAAQRQGGVYLTAAFDYGEYVCQFETGVDDIPRFDTFIEVYGPDRVVKVQYDTPYIRHLPTRLIVTEANGQAGQTSRIIQPAWDDPFVVEWGAFYDNVTNGRTPKTSPEDFRHDLELFQEMIRLMRR